ncbi:MAG: hypothetical protein M9932_15745 [Xanthobacteraceae bacterium]|nr:hypothetical protein [Xanthobacteraceae bacterium]
MRNAAATVVLMAALAVGMIDTARAEVPARPRFVATLSNHWPLAFGMNPAEVADALRTALVYAGGGRHNEIYRAERTINGSLFFPRRDQLYLQFRHGRLTGWKGDWNLDATWR